MTRKELEDHLRAFVNGRLLGAGAGVAVNEETLLFEEGIINSLRILDLIAFVEATLERKIPDEAIKLANFRSIRAIGRAFLPDATDGSGS